MKKIYLIEDTSFVVSLMNSADPNHGCALSLFKEFVNYHNKVRIVIPSIVVFETLFALIRNRIPKSIVQEKLWRLLMVYDVFNYPILETTALRIGPRMERCILNLPQEAKLQANDLIVMATSLEFENAPILTFDKQMKTQFSSIHGNIYYGLDNEDYKKIINLINNKD